MFYKYNIVDDTTGIIISQIGVDLDNDQNAISDNTPPGLTAYQGDENDTPGDFYYVSGVKTARPEFSTVVSWNTLEITADGVSSATMSGLPNPTTILVTVPQNLGLDIPGEFVETSGSFTLTTTVVGTYDVFIEAFPFKTTVYSVVAS